MSILVSTLISETTGVKRYPLMQNSLMVEWRLQATTHRWLLKVKSSMLLMRVSV